MNTIFRLRYEELGGHTHIRVFAGTGPASLGLCGTLVMRNEEWDKFTRVVAASRNVEVLPESGDWHESTRATLPPDNSE
jgi:hypothetical protein